MFDIKEYITEANDSLNEAIDNDWQELRQELLVAARGLTHTIDNSNSPKELGDSGYDPKKLTKAMTKSRKFLAKILKLETEWNGVSRTF